MGPQPHKITYCCAISACQEAGRWRQAAALLQMAEAQSVKADAPMVNAAIGACGYAQETEKRAKHEHVSFGSEPSWENGLAPKPTVETPS